MTDPEHLWERYWETGWHKVRVTKATSKRIFVPADWRGKNQYSLDREMLERCGSIGVRRATAGMVIFYTDAGKAAWDALHPWAADIVHREDRKREQAQEKKRQREERDKEWTRRLWAELRDTATPEDYALLGVNANATRADVTRSFRELSKKRHPDIGGDPDAFRDLVEARNRVMRRAAT